MSNALVNLAFYRFLRIEEKLGDLQALRARLRPIFREWDLKGSFLLAPEGINAMVTGTRENIELLKAFAKNEFGCIDSDFKEGEVAYHSFNRLLLKVKKEIITVGAPEVRPDERTGQRLHPKELERWLDEKKPIVLLDTRNNYEINVGTFSGAINLGIDRSRDFKERAEEILPSLEGKTVVAFCTGGIRCEKASAVLLELGLKDVYQLEGGILRYFEENGARHFDGDCFVFDWRLAVDGKLKPIPRSSEPDESFGRHVTPTFSSEC
jgi:UPF0176 protein